MIGIECVDGVGGLLVWAKGVVGVRGGAAPAPAPRLDRGTYGVYVVCSCCVVGAVRCGGGGKGPALASMTGGAEVAA